MPDGLGDAGVLVRYLVICARWAGVGVFSATVAIDGQVRVFSQTDTWNGLSAVKGVRCQSLHRSGG